MFLNLHFLKVQRVLTSDVQLKSATRALSEITERLIRQKKLKGIGQHSLYLDIVRDVINLLPVHWLSTYIVSLAYAVPRHALEIVPLILS